MPRPKNGYFLKDGTSVPGVTSVISRFKDSSALIKWAFNQGKLGRPTLYGHLENEANVGTCVHDMADLALDGKSQDEIVEFCYKALLDPVDRGRAMAAFKAYKEWESAFRVRVVDRELSIVSERYRCGMTLDRVIVVGNALGLLDFKTSSGVYADQVIQLAAYEKLYEERFPERKLDGGCHLIRLPKDGSTFEHRHYVDLRPAWRLFKFYRQAFDLSLAVADRTFLAGAPRQLEKPKRPRKPREAPPASVFPSCYTAQVSSITYGEVS